jgi:hypothetical protein
VVCVEWFDPLMAAGNWVPEMVELAGGHDVLGSRGRHSAWLEWEKLAQADPDMILLMPCGFGLDRTRREAAAQVQERPEWRKLRAVKSKNVFVTDGNYYFNRPGPRVVESIEILAEISPAQAFLLRPREQGLGAAARAHANRFDGIASLPHAVQPALLSCEGRPLLVINAVGHASRVIPVAIIGQNKPRPPRKWHRQITHVTAVVDLHGRGLIFNGLAANGAEEIRQWRLHTRFGFPVPKHFQDQARISMNLRVIRNVKVRHLAGAFQVG